jgi:hypothetical protein
MTPAAEPLPARRLVHGILITVAVAVVCGRIVGAARVYEPDLFRNPADPSDMRGIWPPTRPEPMPTYGDNDRSRWDTVRALVDDGTYRIGRRDRAVVLMSAAASVGAPDPLQAAVLSAAGYEARVKSDSGIITQGGWKTIDKVLHPERLEFYSSKPPLLATLAAGEYWLLKRALGWSITDQRWEVVRTILLTVNVLPFLVYLLLLGRLADRFGRTDWGRLYVLAAACFGTFLTTFATTFNNHSVAACTALFALYPVLVIWTEGKGCVWLYPLAGLFAGLTFCNELPAGALAAGLFVLLLLRSPWRTLLGFVPAAAVPVAALLFTNYLAVGQLRPAYSEFGGPWYEFEGSYWTIAPGQLKHGIDWAYLTEGRGTYAFHVLLGHHGLFSLTPVFLLSAAGVVYLLLRRPARRGRQPPEPLKNPGAGPPRSPPGALAILTLFVAVVVIGFYILIVGDRNRNYGGWTSAPRWLMWLTPLLLLTALPIADWLASSRWGRGLAYVLLGLSVMSASYPAWTPWRHPWIYDFMEARGWIPY